MAKRLLKVSASPYLLLLVPLGLAFLVVPSVALAVSVELVSLDVQPGGTKSRGF